MKLIVGLGNPGAEYAGTRHNVGFEVIDVLAKRHSINVSKRNFQAVYGDGVVAGERVILVRPMTYMNLSGEAVGALMRFFKIPIEDIVIILDDSALSPGKLRLRFKGSAGGQKGLANLINLLHTEEIQRIRIGIGAPPSGQMTNHVLSKFTKDEAPLLQESFERCADAVECVLREGFVMAMTKFNPAEKTDEKKNEKSDERIVARNNAKNVDIVENKTHSNQGADSVKQT